MSDILEALSTACNGLEVCPTESKKALAREDVDLWDRGDIGTDELRAFCHAIDTGRTISQGMRPAHFTEHATCKHCGPVWLWIAGDVLGCPWCRNRLNDRPIPRPVSVRCGNCQHFKRTNRPHLGRCGKGEPEAIGGLWNDSPRNCDRHLPVIFP